MTARYALDTSVAVPLVVRTHNAHATVVNWWRGRDVALSGHALAETYSVLTRLPGDVRLTPTDAATLLAERFGSPLLLEAEVARHLPELLSRLDIAGGAVYDAMVALAAAGNDCPLATRDARARPTYDAIGVQIEVVGISL